MKKNAVKILLCAVALALLLSLAACGGNQDEESSGAGREPESASAPQSVQADSAQPEEESGTTLEELCSDPLVKSQLESAISQLEDGTMTLEYEVSGNVFTYRFTYTDASQDYSLVGDLLAQELERQGNQFVDLAKNFDSELKQENACTVVVQYFDPDGKLLAERSYTAADTFDTSLEELQGETYETLEDYFANPTVKSSLDSMIAGMEQEGMSVSLDVSGNEFAVTIQITDASMVNDSTAGALAAALDEQTETYLEQVTQFDGVIGQPGACTVRMRYTDPDGNLLAEKEFKAQ